MNGKSGALLLGLVLLVITVIASFFALGEGDSVVERVKTYLVVPTSFKLMVNERGVVRPERVVAIKSSISSNQAQLVWLLEEGRRVQKGRVIARFDTKPFMDKHQLAEQELIDLTASYQAALRAQELQQESAEGLIEAAQRKLAIAKIKADDIHNGTGPLKREQLQQQQQQQQRELELAAAELKDFQILLADQHVSQREFQKVRNTHQLKLESLQMAQAALANFERYEWQRMLKEAQVLMDSAEEELGRVRRTSEIEAQRNRSEVEKFRRRVISAQKKVDAAARDIIACDVVAPIAGVLLHSKLQRQERKQKIQLGDTIWQGQTFMEIPDTSGLIAEIEVREIDVAKLEQGMKTEITMDALPDKRFGGELISINPLASEDSESGVRRFKVRVRFLERASAIHVGMSANVAVIHRELQDVPAIPITALMYHEGRPYVQRYSSESGDARFTVVELGYVGIEWAEVITGVELGETVVVEPKVTPRTIFDG
ncbi:MAG: efflux RND transporter periplasmic adaptor subunit [Gammaproteobacteria bacterium]|nr:efflux RND transporter periplasmic adaptor subunit [Gammaproteobacteria bacterium]